VHSAPPDLAEVPKWPEAPGHRVDPSVSSRDVGWTGSVRDGYREGRRQAGGFTPVGAGDIVHGDAVQEADARGVVNAPSPYSPELPEGCVGRMAENVDAYLWLHGSDSLQPAAGLLEAMDRVASRGHPRSFMTPRDLAVGRMAMGPGFARGTVSRRDAPRPPAMPARGVKIIFRRGHTMKEPPTDFSDRCLNCSFRGAPQQPVSPTGLCARRHSVVVRVHESSFLVALVEGKCKVAEDGARWPVSSTARFALPDDEGRSGASEVRSLTGNWAWLKACW